MTKLEDFERTASDPNRFFAKGSKLHLDLLIIFPFTFFSTQNLPQNLVAMDSKFSVRSVGIL